MNVRNQANDTWNSVLIADGDIDFDGNKGINVGDATNPTDAMNQQSSDARYVELAGDTMVGDLNMGTNVINLTNPPVAGTNVANKDYVDAEVASGGIGTFVELAGDTMDPGSFLTLDADPLNPLHAATKNYVDTKAVLLTGALPMSGFLTLSGDPVIGVHAATKTYVDSVAGVGDGVVNGGSFNGFSSGGTLTLTRTNALPNVLVTAMNDHPHNAINVDYTASVANFLACTFPSISGFTVQSVLDQFDEQIKNLTDPNPRQINVTGDLAAGILTLGYTYPCETNRLQVFANTVAGPPDGNRKMIASTRGISTATYNSETFCNTPTGLANDATVYQFNIDIDSTADIAVSVVGSSAQTFGALANAITFALSTAGAPYAGTVARLDNGILTFYNPTVGGGTDTVVTATGAPAVAPFLFDATEKGETTVMDFVPVSGATLSAAGPGDYFFIDSTTTSYYVWFDNTVTTDPTPGGTGITVSFTGGDSSQTISDSVVAALIGADGDFAGADNVAGTSTVMTVTLVTTGDVPDTALGVFPPPTPGIVQIIDGVIPVIDNSAGVGVTHEYDEIGNAFTDSTTIDMSTIAPLVGFIETIRIK